MKKEIKKFLSYVIVGGSAAIVEWVTFFLFNLILNYNWSTIISFIFGIKFKNKILGM